MYEENFCIKRIKELMERNNYNPYRLAKKSGISLSTLTSMFEKNTDPRVQTIEKICSIPCTENRNVSTALTILSIK